VRPKTRKGKPTSPASFFSVLTLGWELFWMKASGKWEKYPELKPINHLQLLVDEIGHDPHRVFWGSEEA
jgi:hypothetical protein